MKMTERSRGWCMTLNNPTEGAVDRLVKYMEKHVKYGVVGEEVGESGTPHLQIYMEYETMKSFKQMKELNKLWHVEKRIGTMLQASDYCKKDGKYREVGELAVSKQGKRNDINVVKEAVKTGVNMRGICELTNSYQALKYAETLRKYMCAKRTWKTEIYWFYGPTGTGKSRRAFDMTNIDDRWISMDSLKWFDGYDGQSDIIIDDFRCTDVTMKFLLRLFDRYELNVEIKGGVTAMLAKRIFVTTNNKPEKAFEGCCFEDMQQLIRRIEHIEYFNGNKCDECGKYYSADELPDCCI